MIRLTVPNRRLTSAGLAVALVLGIAGTCTGMPTNAHAAEKSDATDYTWSIDLDCSLCHERQYASLGLETEGSASDTKAKTAENEDESNGKGSSTNKKTDIKTEANAETTESSADLGAISSYASMHAQSLQLTCTSCHEDTEGLAKGHKKLNSGKEAKRLKKSEVSSDVCLTCHNQTELAETTKDCTILTDENGTVVNPHDIPDVEDHGDITCTSCHTVHDTEDGIAKTALTTCTNCHHADVFECGTCH